MYEYFLGDQQHTIKDRWEELDAVEFIYLFKLLEQYNRGELSVGDLRTKMVLKLLNLERVRVKSYMQESRFEENVYHLQSQLTFIFRIVYDDKRFNGLSAALKRELERHEPYEMSDIPEERLAARFKRHYEVDSVFCRNLISQLKGVPGYSITNQGGILTTSLTAARFCDAVTISDSFIKRNDLRLLDTLVSILYFEGAYEPTEAHKRACFFNDLPRHVKQAVFFNFQAVLSFLYNRTKYRVLFSKSGKPAGVYSSGLSGSLITMGKEYGGVQAVGNAGLIDFLEMMVDSLVNYVRELKAMDKSVVEIAEKTKLDVQTVNEML